MHIVPSIKNKHDMQVLRQQIYELCLEKPLTITDLKNITGYAKAKLAYPLDYLEKENHIIKSRHLDRKTKKWNNYYRGDVKRYKAQNLEDMQKEYNLQRTQRALDVAGPYDHLIKANPNLRVIKLEHTRTGTSQGRRKEKFRGIGSCFAMFEGA
jgi:predicted transcriptional regulator